MSERTKLLLLVDVQNGFVTTDETRAVVPRINELIEKWQSNGWPIVASRFTNLPGSNYERLRDWHEMLGEPATGLYEGLELVTPYVFKKGTYSAWSDEVSAVCASHDVRDVVIVGVDTNECVLATAIAVFDAGFAPWVVADCCASTGGKRSHDMALELLRALLGEQQVVLAHNLLD